MSRRVQLPPLNEALGYDRDSDPFPGLPPLPSFSQSRYLRATSSLAQLPPLSSLPPLPPLSSSTSYAPPRSASPSRELFERPYPRHSRSARDIRDDKYIPSFSSAPFGLTTTSNIYDSQDLEEKPYRRAAMPPPLDGSARRQLAPRSAFSRFDAMSAFEGDEDDAFLRTPRRKGSATNLRSTGISPIIGSLGLEVSEGGSLAKQSLPGYGRTARRTLSRTPSYDSLSVSGSSTSKLSDSAATYERFEETELDSLGRRYKEEGDWTKGPNLRETDHERESSGSSSSSVPLSSGSGSGSGSSSSRRISPSASSYPTDSEGKYLSSIPLPALRSARSGPFSLSAHLPPLPPLRGSSSMLPLTGSSSQVGSPFDLDFYPNSEIPFTGQKMHACAVCGKLFARPSALSTHMNSHTGDKPYQCSVCGKGFGVASNLRRHMRTHDGTVI